MSKTERVFLKIIISAFLVVLPLFVLSQKAVVSIDRKQILIGEQIQLGLKFSFPSGSGDVSFPQFENDTITQFIEIIHRNETDTLSAGEKITELQQVYMITSFDSGRQVIPSLPFLWYDKGKSEPEIIFSDSMFFDVGMVEVDTTQAIKDIKDPWGIPFQWMDYIWHFIIGLLLIVIVIVLLYIYNRRKKGLPLFPARTIPLLPPHEEALKALDRIKEEKVWRSGMIKDYYTVLTDTLRRYIERRFDIDAPEMTSAETIDALSQTEADQESARKLEHVLKTADMVKFAKANPVVTENENCLTLAYDFVLHTKKEVSEDEESKTDVNSKEDEG